MTTWDFAAVTVAVFLGGATQAFSGFGFALMSVPILSAALGPREAVVLASELTLMSSALVAGRHRLAIRHDLARPMLVAAMVGLVPGLWVLTVAPERALTAAVALVVLVMIAAESAGFAPTTDGRGLEVGAGAMHGFLKTSVGVSGPPVVLALRARGTETHEFRATTSFVILVTNSVGLILLAAGGKVTGHLVVAGLLGIPVLFAGNRVGTALTHRLDPNRFRNVVTALLVFSAVVALISAVFE